MGWELLAPDERHGSPGRGLSKPGSWKAGSVPPFPRLEAIYPEIPGLSSFPSPFLEKETCSGRAREPRGGPGWPAAAAAWGRAERRRQASRSKCRLTVQRLGHCDLGQSIQALGLTASARRVHSDYLEGQQGRVAKLQGSSGSGRAADQRLYLSSASCELLTLDKLALCLYMLP